MIWEGQQIIVLVQEGLHSSTPNTTCGKGFTYLHSHYHSTCHQNQSPNSTGPTTTPGALSWRPYSSIRTYGTLLMDLNPIPPAMPIQRPFKLMRKRFNKLMPKLYSTLNQTSTLMSRREDLLRSGRACAKCTLYMDLPHGSQCIDTFLQWRSPTAKQCSNVLLQSNTLLTTFTKQASPLMLKHLNHSKSESRPEKRKPLSSSSPAASDIHMGNLTLLSMPHHLTNSPSIMSLLAFSTRSCAKPHLIAFLSLGSKLINRPLVPRYKTTSTFQGLPATIAMDRDITSPIAPVHPWMLWERQPLIVLKKSWMGTHGHSNSMNSVLIKGVCRCFIHWTIISTYYASIS